VNDEQLHATFSKWPSFQRARVVRAKGKKGNLGPSKGFGFVSFMDPAECFGFVSFMDPAEV
ncbi:hypothetical protein KIPB_016379, partial [Kipferlia bialata]